jgi:Uma2 family endonuclease
MTTSVLRRRFTVDEYYRMAEAGILKPDDRVELIEGEIIRMSPIGSRHAACVDRLNQVLVPAAAARAIVRVQNPFRIGSHSEPEPDLMLLRPRTDFYASGHPGPADVLLLIEVVDSTPEVELEAKIRLYARSGVAEVWVVDLNRRKVDVHRAPRGEAYADVSGRGPADILSPLAFEDLRIPHESLGL